jgi:hypothetical protein
MDNKNALGFSGGGGVCVCDVSAIALHFIYNRIAIHNIIPVVYVHV